MVEFFSRNQQVEILSVMYRDNPGGPRILRQAHMGLMTFKLHMYINTSRTLLPHRLVIRENRQKQLNSTINR